MKYFNNPLNIRSGSKWLGLCGNKNGFCQFDNVSYCIRAGLYLLIRNYPKHNCHTIAECISRWAPPSENLTDNYIGFVTHYTSLDKNRIVTKLQYSELFDLFKAMCWVESHYFLSSEVFYSGYNLYFKK